MSLESSANNKRIAKNTLLLYARMLLVMGVSLFTSRVNLHSLGVEDFGIYNVVGGVVAMFSMFSGALSVSISRNITYEMGTGNKQKLRDVFSTAINIQVIIAIFIIFLAELIGVWFLNNRMIIPAERMNAANWVLQFSIFAFAINLMSVPYNADIVAHERMSAFAYIGVLEVFLKLGIAYLIYISPIDRLIMFSGLLFLSSLLLRLIYSIYCKKHFDECDYHWIYNPQLVKQMLGFAGWSMFGLVAYTGYTYGLNVLLNIFFGPVVNAARGIAVQVQTAIQGFSHNFQMAINPQIIKSYAAKDVRRTHQLIYSGSKLCFFLLLLFAIPIIIEAPMLLKLWLEVVPEHTVNFLRLIMLIITFDSLGSPLSTAQQATGNIKLYQIVVGGVMLFIIPVSYICLDNGGAPETVYIVYFVACVIAHMCRLFIIRGMIQLPIIGYIRKVIIPIGKVSAFSFLLPSILYYFVKNEFFAFVLICVSSFLSVFASVYLFGLSKVEQELTKVKVIEFISKCNKRKN